MTRINWSDSSIKTAAAIIFEINPNRHQTVESVESYIISVTSAYVHRQIANDDTVTFTGTGGWYVTLGPDSDEGYDYWAEVTIMPYVVKRYLEGVKNKLANVLIPDKNR
jgi:hypothetical protein